jgi:protein-S-isoprenylcysteine O-methyltransferase
MRIADDLDAAASVVTLPSSDWLGLAYLLSEIGLSVFKRSKHTHGEDRGSAELLWITISASIGLAMVVRAKTPWANLPALEALRPAWLALFIAALGLRWWAIVHLGRFFTVNVAIAKDQVVIDDGPYRYVRHPSYTGALLAFLAYALYVGHWIWLVMMMVPISMAFARRIAIEEAALSAGLGEPYRAYMRRTKRLVPFVL